MLRVQPCDGISILTEEESCISVMCVVTSFSFLALFHFFLSDFYYFLPFVDTVLCSFPLDDKSGWLFKIFLSCGWPVSL